MAKRLPRDFEERTTMGPGQVEIGSPPATPPAVPPVKFYVGSDHAPTEAEALEMGYALFDQIATHRARMARAEND